jgi:anhydro-N-acetylmuramic acid kinase
MSLAAHAADRYIGLMSGTSLDGVDGVLVDLGACDQGQVRVLAHAHRPFDPAVAAELLALNQAGPNELHRAALAANRLAQLSAAVVQALLSDAGLGPADVRAIGSHGQTVRHAPGEFDGLGYTLQLNNPALLADLTGIDVVGDLRSRDVAAGGQGAPLVPAFHQALFASTGSHRAVLNLGGIANLTLLPADGQTAGFDCGPANVLLDGWCHRHLGQAFDRDGAWAAQGAIDAQLLTAMQSDPYFDAPPPKSTGRDRFHLRWLDAHLAALPAVRPVDVQASLAELTSWAAASALKRHLPGVQELLVCGGGARNGHLMARLRAALPNCGVVCTDTAGLPAEQVEAVAFAWLARCCVLRRPANLPRVTGAAGPRVLGALYPAA